MVIVLRDDAIHAVIIVFIWSDRNQFYYYHNTYSPCLLSTQCHLCTVCVCVTSVVCISPPMRTYMVAVEEMQVDMNLYVVG